MKIKLFKPHFGQRKIIDGFGDSDHKFGVVATGRQFGKSLLAQNLLLYWLLKNKNSKGAWISPIYNQSKKVFQELSNAANPVITHSNKADLTMTFVNGSTLVFLSAERYDSIRGFSFSHMVVDEAAFIKEIAMQEAIFPTLSALGKKCLIISTPKSKNWFYNAFLKGSNEGSDYISFRGISTDNPHISQTFIDEQRKSLPEEIFKQEYLAEFSESGNDVFKGVDAISILNGWTNPQSNKRYYAGVDFGLQHDYSVLSIMDESGRVCRIERVNGTTYQEVVSKFANVLRPYKIAGGYAEINGVGLPVFEGLRAQERRLKEWTTNNSNKADGVRNLIYDIQEGKLELPSKQFFPALYNELSAYSYKISPTGTMTFNAPSGFHDDCVMSLMLANEARRNVGGGSKIYIGNIR